MQRPRATRAPRTVGQLAEQSGVSARTLRYYEDLGIQEGRSWSFEFNLTPYVVTCAMACGMLFVTRFVQKHFFNR